MNTVDLKLALTFAWTTPLVKVHQIYSVRHNTKKEAEGRKRETQKVSLKTNMSANIKLNNNHEPSNTLKEIVEL